MGYIKINQEKVNKEVAQKLIELCPFNAFDYNDAYLSVNSACKVCKICVHKGPKDICEFIEIKKPQIDKSKYKGIVVYIEHRNALIHPVSFELIGKALTLAKVTQEPVSAILIGYGLNHMKDELLSFGVDYVYVYEHKNLKSFNIKMHTAVMASFFKMYLNNVFLIGGTALGRSFAPSVAAQLKTGLTADCTKLEMTKDGDLMQIRPAFGGNIMAKIHTPNHRPQMATIRYKMFDAPDKVKPTGKIVYPAFDFDGLSSTIDLIDVIHNPTIFDLSDAQVIIAVGRAFKKEKDLELIEPLRKKLNAQIGCTRPLIENGWFDAKRQIGLSGRTVKPKLIINLGISGAIQYIEGMKSSELIISVNEDPQNKLFDISHYAIVGNIYEVLPELNQLIDKIWQVKT